LGVWAPGVRKEKVAADKALAQAPEELPISAGIAICKPEQFGLFLTIRLSDGASHRTSTFENRHSLSMPPTVPYLGRPRAETPRDCL